MPESSDILKLTAALYNQGILELTARDPDLARVVSKWGKPPFWTAAPGFPGIVFAILSQQVSLESANATLGKLEVKIGTPSPESLLSLDDSELKNIGFSRQKASYIRGVATGIVAGKLDLHDLESMPDDGVREKLIEIRGIGRWTADTYLLFSLRRSDVWPPGDLALIKAIRELKNSYANPNPSDIEEIAGGWTPWRSVAARILWHYYLCERGRKASF